MTPSNRRNQVNARGDPAHRQDHCSNHARALGDSKIHRKDFGDRVDVIHRGSVDAHVTRLGHQKERTGKPEAQYKVIVARRSNAPSWRGTEPALDDFEVSRDCANGLIAGVRVLFHTFPN